MVDCEYSIPDSVVPSKNIHGLLYEEVGLVGSEAKSIRSFEPSVNVFRWFGLLCLLVSKVVDGELLLALISLTAITRFLFGFLVNSLSRSTTICFRCTPYV